MRNFRWVPNNRLGLASDIGSVTFEIKSHEKPKMVLPRGGYQIRKFIPPSPGREFPKSVITQISGL